MKLYMGGKLKIGGDVMASQKLGTCSRIDPRGGDEGRPRQVRRRATGGRGTRSGATAAAPAASKGSVGAVPSSRRWASG